ncbi:hypothetical protein BH11ARM1_BH11ARM1_12410 [soil metagenome]
MADSLYLEISGFVGTVAQKDYVHAIEVGYFSFDLNRAIEPVSFSGLTITFLPGGLANQFMQYATHGIDLGSVVLTQYSPSLNHAMHQYTLDGARISKYDLHQISGSQGSPSATLLLSANRITYKAYYQDNNGVWLSRSNYYDFLSQSGA